MKLNIFKSHGDSNTAEERPVPLEQVEAEDQQHENRFWLGLTAKEFRLMMLAGVGFFLDSYDLFIINLVTPIFEYLYWGGIEKGPNGKGHYPSGIRGLVNAASNIGNIFGQLMFGFMGDFFGRKFVYGKEMIIVIIATILLIAMPKSIHSPLSKMMWVFCWRWLLGVGIGGDYPMSAAITSERSKLNRRGTLISLIFAFQGFGTLAGAIVTIILLGCFEHPLNREGHYRKLEGVWRLQFGLALVPAIGVLIPRLMMEETQKFKNSQQLNSGDNRDPKTSLNFEDDELVKNPSVTKGHPEIHESSENYLSRSNTVENEPENIEKQFESVSAPANRSGFIQYFRQWHHFKHLLGTSVCWFLLDIAFYGVNLNQSVILKNIGFSSGTNEYRTLMKNAIGNLIIAVAGYVPGYWFNVFLVEILGRKWIQLQGFVITGLMFAILAGRWNEISTGGRFACFVIAQLFSNFGPNSTTFIYPAEVFPARVRGTAHGISAALGKCGAILASLLFNFLTSIIGYGNVMWIFCGCMWGGILFTLLLPETKGRDADEIDRVELFYGGDGKVECNSKWKSWYVNGIF
ncbi:plasma membrane inorganic phosphate transmembrane transporter Pho841 [Schizosaccharomyces pombe]|uniref:Inorganic phosphate transporter pho841 n=1 Tax=Schizosaccharomyces pombe (strain 972 / ATCC 24843) TaxID=284812 RepID=PH841_SCHPO|nr:putative inorganic phosphate transporter [Schizosaccharomyces pombe]Q9P6J9.1 RecName: Full=Putative inorganic phosphate transporter C1683.01 [Schizosaccharomyces pombe 972h-]CAB91163.1 inorganic phosphate transporter (predicted) [Schizosaccharomyces pombe]|eukprot:NP_595057.1 putative inorganic phosphate transporter [Schizosaccharomyces pombe]